MIATGMPSFACPMTSSAAEANSSAIAICLILKTYSYAKAVKAFFSKDVNASNQILEHQREIERMDQEIASKAFMSKQKNALTVCAICSIREDIKKIADCAADIAEIVINRAYKMAI